MADFPKQNPFPGIDPWMQGVWHDVHTMLIGYVRDELCDELPEDLVARAKEGVEITPLGGETLRRIPDVSVSSYSDAWKSGETVSWTPDVDDAGLAALVEPDPIEPQTERWVEIRTVGDNKLVTAIEILSPANKVGDGHRHYRDKVTRLLYGGVSVVEIDLIRGGEARQIRPCGEGGAELLSSLHRIYVMTPDQPKQARVYPCHLRQPIPKISIPLRPGEAEISLDLQPLIDRCYTRGRYWAIDRECDPEPALSSSDLDWARQQG